MNIKGNMVSEILKIKIIQSIYYRMFLYTAKCMFTMKTEEIEEIQKIEKKILRKIWRPLKIEMRKFRHRKNEDMHK